MGAEQDTTAELRTGQVLAGKYRIGDELGRGGMGRVFAAENIDIGRRVAIKVLRAQLTGDQAFVDRFRREARAAVAIDHPGIVDILDVGEEAGHPFIVMELLSGEALRARIERMGRMPIDEVIGVATEVLAALEYAHRKGIIHRDLKPDNIFLAAPPRQGVKLLDFGISKFSDSDDVTVTASGAVAGTPLYMPPEQAKGIRDVGPRGDLYALGAVLYHALAGTPPFTGESFGEVIANVLTEPLVPIESRRPEVPSEVARTINSLLARDPDDRPESARKVRAALSRVPVDGATPGSLADTMPADDLARDAGDADIGTARTMAVRSELGEAATELVNEATAATVTPAAAAPTVAAPTTHRRRSASRHLLWLIPVVLAMAMVAVLAALRLGEKPRLLSTVPPPPPLATTAPDAGVPPLPAHTPEPTADASQAVTITLRATPAAARWSVIDPAPTKDLRKLRKLDSKARTRLLASASPLPCDSSRCELTRNRGTVVLAIAQAKGRAPAILPIELDRPREVEVELEARRPRPEPTPTPKKQPDAGSDSLVGTNPLND